MIDVQNTMWLINEDKQVNSKTHIFESNCVDKSSYSIDSDCVHIYKIKKEIAPYCTKLTNKVIYKHLKCNVTYNISYVNLL